MPDGTVDVINDPCTRIAAGTPVVWHELPNAGVSQDTLICEGDTAGLSFNFPAGNGPFQVVVNDGNADSVYAGFPMVTSFR